MEGHRRTIRLEDDQDPLKVRARVIIGRDGDSQQREALRNFNGHLHRVEVLTFDHLVRIAKRAIEMFDGTVVPEEPPLILDVDDDDIPF